MEVWSKKRPASWEGAAECAERAVRGGPPPPSPLLPLLLLFMQAGPWGPAPASPPASPPASLLQCERGTRECCCWPLEEDDEEDEEEASAACPERSNKVLPSETSPPCDAADVALEWSLQRREKEHRQTYIMLLTSRSKKENTTWITS